MHQNPLGLLPGLQFLPSPRTCRHPQPLVLTNSSAPSKFPTSNINAGAASPNPIPAFLLPPDSRTRLYSRPKAPVAARAGTNDTAKL